METRLGTCTGVAGEILAIRKELYEPPPEEIINDDFYFGMRVIKRGFNIIYVPDALSYEQASSSAQDEMTRRTRINAGRYQALRFASDLLPLDRPLVLWQVLSHKFLRPLVPMAMLGALIANIIAVVRPAINFDSVWLTLSAPINWLILGLQLLFYSLAVVGNIFKLSGKVGKLLYLPTFLLNSNISALIGLIKFITGRQTALWQRVDRSAIEDFPVPQRKKPDKGL
jgi:poly-beta-1,6-N-acetyl-D-glucosamine synthase